MPDSYCTHLECRSAAVQELQWMIKKLPHRAKELREVAGDLMTRHDVEVRCHKPEGFERHSWPL